MQVVRLFSDLGFFDYLDKTKMEGLNGVALVQRSRTEWIDEFG